MYYLKKSIYNLLSIALLDAIVFSCLFWYCYLLRQCVLLHTPLIISFSYLLSQFLFIRIPLPLFYKSIFKAFYSNLYISSINRNKRLVYRTEYITKTACIFILFYLKMNFSIFFSYWNIVFFPSEFPYDFFSGIN